MNVTIVGFANNEEDLRLLDDKMEEMIEKSQCFLFNVVCGGPGSAGAEWARRKGAPTRFMDGADVDKLIAATDYLVAKYDGSTMMHKVIFKFMQTGRHGTVIEGVPWK